jgi:hypothetical protein
LGQFCDFWETVCGREGGFEGRLPNEGMRESDARILVIGGSNGGMSALDGRVVSGQRLAGRCGFITSEKVRELFD